MKHNIDALFQVETNRNFSWDVVTSLDSATEMSLHSLAEAYELPDYRKLSLLKKRNLATQLYKWECDTFSFVIRSAKRVKPGILEKQCCIAHRIHSSSTIKPLVATNGQYVTQIQDTDWIAYPYYEGENFSGSNSPVISVIEQCTKFFLELSHVEDVEPFQCPNYRDKEDLSYVIRFFDSEYFRTKPFTTLVSEPIRNMLLENRDELDLLVEEISLLDTSSGFVLTHNDLHHANILIMNEGTLMLDLEAIGFDNVQLALAHSVFKLLRHCVYAGVHSPDDVRHEIATQAIDRIAASSAPIHDCRTLYLYGQCRILSDIRANLLQLQKPTNFNLPTDLEKRILNLFEFDYLMKMCCEGAKWT